jgi:hypothetical protein
MAVWYSLWSFGILSQFGIIGPRKIWQPCCFGCLLKHFSRISASYPILLSMSRPFNKLDLMQYTLHIANIFAQNKASVGLYLISAFRKKKN